MVMSMCMIPLLSGILSYQDPSSYTYNKNNDLFYDIYTTHQTFAIIDKYNINNFCEKQKVRFADVKKVNKLRLVSELNSD
jgi:hypothetical protein